MNLFESVTEEVAPSILQDETPLSILKMILDVHRYFNSPGMRVIDFETKFDRLKIQAEKIIAQREREVGVKL